jgi:hypothetical protein
VIPSLPYTDNGTTAGFVDDYDEVCPFNNPGAPDMVYQYTPTTNAVVDVSLCGSTTAYDTKLYVYENGYPTSGTGSTGTFVGCNDDFCTNPPLFNSAFISQVSGVVMTAGNTYYIVVDGYSTFSSGNFTLDVASTPGNAAAVAITAPGIGGCPFTASEPVSFTYTNVGTPVDSVFLSLTVDGALIATDTVTGLISPGDTVPHTFSATADLSAAGFHEIEVSATAPNDGDPNNDIIATLVRNFDLQPFPWPTVTFTGYNSGNLNQLSPEWAEAQGGLSVTGFPLDGFFVPWNAGSGPQTAALGSETAQINLWTTGTSGWLVGPRFTASASYRLVFKAAVMAFGSTNASGMGTDDAVYVMVSNDCGVTWTSEFAIDQSNQPPNSLTPFEVDLSAYAGQGIYIAFYANSNDPGADIDAHIDNVQVANFFPIDVGITAFWRLYPDRNR